MDWMFEKKWNENIHFCTILYIKYNIDFYRAFYFSTKRNRIESDLTVVQRNNVMIMKIHSCMQSIICNYPMIMPVAIRKTSRFFQDSFNPLSNAGIKFLYIN